MGTASAGPSEILIEGEERVAKTNDPLVSGHIANRSASEDRLLKDEVQSTVSDRNGAESVAANVSDATNQSNAAVAPNLNDGGSASPTPPASDGTEFSPDAAQRAADLDHLSLAAPLTPEAPSHSTEAPLVTESSPAVDPSAISDSATETFGGFDTQAMAPAETLTDFDWTEQIADVEVPDLGALPEFGDVELSLPSDPETPF
jgi:hypothetical protein